MDIAILYITKFSTQCLHYLVSRSQLPARSILGSGQAGSGYVRLPSIGSSIPTRSNQCMATTVCIIIDDSTWYSTPANKCTRAGKRNKSTAAGSRISPSHCRLHYGDLTLQAIQLRISINFCYTTQVPSLAICLK